MKYLSEVYRPVDVTQPLKVGDYVRRRDTGAIYLLCVTDPYVVAAMSVTQGRKLTNTATVKSTVKLTRTDMDAILGDATHWDKLGENPVYANKKIESIALTPLVGKSTPDPLRVGAYLTLDGKLYTIVQVDIRKIALVGLQETNRFSQPVDVGSGEGVRGMPISEDRMRQLVANQRWGSWQVVETMEEVTALLNPPSTDAEDVDDDF